MSLADALGTACLAVQRVGRPAAVAALRAAIAPIRSEAETGMRRLAEVVAARSQGGQCGCHVSKTIHELLQEALS